MNKIIQFLTNKRYNGLVDDIRPQSEKDKDWKSIEIYTTGAGQFRDVTDNGWAKYQIRNQDGSGSCVANTVAKMLEIKRYLAKGDKVKFSHAPIYINRVNKPATGMSGTDALTLAIKYSSCPESALPSENMNDSELDSIKLPSNYENLNNLVVPTNYVVCNLDFNLASELVAKEGSLMLWVNTSYNSWCKDIPTAGGKDGGIRHSVTIVDAIRFNNVEYLVIEDSWGNFGKYDGQRLITREFFNDSVYFMATLTEFKYDITSIRFVPFNIVMKLNDKFDEVKRLQDFLKSQGLFPSNIESTGFYGNVTAKAVYAFQIKYNVAPLNELDQLKGKRVGLKTLTKINELI